MMLFRKEHNSWFHDLLVLVITILVPKTVCFPVTHEKHAEERQKTNKPSV